MFEPFTVGAYGAGLGVSIAVGHFATWLFAMMAWLGTKLAANWRARDAADVQHIRRLGFSAILGGLVSKLFAFVGGLVISGGYRGSAAEFDLNPPWT